MRLYRAITPAGTRGGSEARAPAAHLSDLCPSIISATRRAPSIRRHLRTRCVTLDGVGEWATTTAAVKRRRPTAIARWPLRRKVSAGPRSCGLDTSARPTVRYSFIPLAMPFSSALIFKFSSWRGRHAACGRSDLAVNSSRHWAHRPIGVPCTVGRAAPLSLAGTTPLAPPPALVRWVRVGKASPLLIFLTCTILNSLDR